MDPLTEGPFAGKTVMMPTPDTLSDEGDER
jgi:hypothetical protein